MSPLASLVRIARQHGLPFLVIGGHAVSQLGYSRLTFDLDLLCAQADREGWLALFCSLGYRVFADEGAFIQLTPTDAADLWPIDLLLVATATFAAMSTASREVRMMGETVHIPAVEHLLALKLHALSSGPPERIGKDYQDIVGILRTQGLDPRSAEIRERLEPYATESWYERILDAFPAI